MNKLSINSLKDQTNLKRLTPQRKAIYSYLKETKSHPTAEDIHRALKPRFPKLSLATVYNTLELLAAHGLVSVLGNISNNCVHFDGDTSPHINLACTSCGNVADFPLTFNETVEHILEDTGFLLKGSRILYYGICAKCQKRNQSDHKETK